MPGECYTMIIARKQSQIYEFVAQHFFGSGRSLRYLL